MIVFVTSSITIIKLELNLLISKTCMYICKCLQKISWKLKHSEYLHLFLFYFYFILKMAVCSFLLLHVFYLHVYCTTFILFLQLRLLIRFKKGKNNLISAWCLLTHKDVLCVCLIFFLTNLKLFLVRFSANLHKFSILRLNDVVNGFSPLLAYLSESLSDIFFSRSQPRAVMEFDLIDR